MIKVSLNKKDASRLIGYIKDVSGRTHYGGGQIETPIEQQLIRLIDKSGESLELSLHRFILLSEFVFEATSEGAGLLPGDRLLVEKLYSALETHYKDLSDNDNLSEIEQLLRIYKIVFLHEPVDTIEPMVERNKAVEMHRTEAEQAKKLDEKLQRISKRIASGEVSRSIHVQSKSMNEKELLREIIRKTKGRGIF
ncbi:hypothetical protein F9K33_16340 [bacterium]|nr:MAG: hypothetical protein F9K33_16340 [bacterium]